MILEDYMLFAMASLNFCAVMYCIKICSDVQTTVQTYMLVDKIRHEKKDKKPTGHARQAVRVKKSPKRFEPLKIVEKDKQRGLDETGFS